jgi:ribosome biogenesis protein BMS1
MRTQRAKKEGRHSGEGRRDKNIKSVQIARGHSFFAPNFSEAKGEMMGREGGGRVHHRTTTATMNLPSDDPKQQHHGHKARKEGRGAKEKKKDRKSKKEGSRTERHNPRAFSVSNIRRTQRTIQRNLDKSQQKEYVPLKDRRSQDGPPSLVVVMGPQGVGKSTLIRSLVKIYTNHNLTTISGPITVVTGKHRRITLFECPNDTASMLDCAKIADLVLLCVDAKFGFEMETFEFLNVLQTHGFPKVMGVFTHLDQFKTMKNLRKTKKLLKHRFWTEIYEGAKMFYFSGIVNGKYLKNEVKQLTLFISRVKVRSFLYFSKA